MKMKNSQQEEKEDCHMEDIGGRGGEEGKEDCHKEEGGGRVGGTRKSCAIGRGDNEELL